ncbi:MAG: hypothetical protein LM600_00860 [Thaumarchaeota archaeon]|nr:hypothetical protein [Nitrososphaerota archaeon]
MSEVKVIERRYIKGGREYRSYYVVIPSDVAKAIGLRGGDTLRVLLREVNIDGTLKAALIYYKPDKK